MEKSTTTWRMCTTNAKLQPCLNTAAMDGSVDRFACGSCMATGIRQMRCSTTDFADARSLHGSREAGHQETEEQI
jgi:hypothetical protein